MFLFPINIKEDALDMYPLRPTFAFPVQKGTTLNIQNA